MTAEIKAEFKKVFSIRSTYIILGLMLALVLFFGFYVAGWHAQKIDLIDPHHLYHVSQNAISFLAIFTSLIGLLLLTHEFRFNTIAYSLTLSNNRSKVLFAKIIVISVLAIVVTAIIGIASPLLAYWGVHANHHQLISQSYYYSGIAWKGLMFGWGYAMAGLVLALLIRNQIGAIITLFIVPSVVEGLFSIWLKNNIVYLPFSALHAMLGDRMGEPNASSISPLHAMYVFLAYLVLAWIIGWYLFLTRDAI